MLQTYPYDPGTGKRHGVKSYQFLKNMKTESDLMAEQGRQTVVIPLTSTLASFYLFLQFFLGCFFDRVRKLAITVKIYPQVIDSEHPKVNTKQPSVREKTLDDNLKIVVDQKNLRSIRIDPACLKEKANCFPYFAQVPIDNVTESRIATTYSTTIFEVSNGGLQHLLQDIRLEIRKNYEGSNDLINGHDSVVACCDVVWSVPSKFRSYWTELALTNELNQRMRTNCQHVYDLICSKYSGLRRIGSGGTVQQAECKQMGREVYSGLHRSFCAELMQLAHERAADEHEYVWSFDPHSTEIKTDWSSIGDLENTTVVALNFVLLKF